MLIVIEDTVYMSFDSVGLVVVSISAFSLYDIELYRVTQI